MNVLIQVAGSISAYKICDVVSRFVKLGHSVKICASKSSLNFVGEATWEGLTGNKVFSDDFTPGQRMDHIHLNKWADITLLAPATAKTLNQLRHGVGDGVINTLWLARDESKPFLIFPAMNPSMWSSDSVKSSVDYLSNILGVKLYTPDSGLMACGDVGTGRLIEPMDIVNESLKFLSLNKKALITFGGTSESIDGVRQITNFSTGDTGVKLANELSKNFKVTSVFAKGIKSEFYSYKKINFKNSDDLEQILKKELQENHYDVVYHLAAVSDYVPAATLDQKLDSKNETLTIELKKRGKILNSIKVWSCNKDLKLISFKLTHNEDSDVIKKKVMSQSIESDYVVQNSLLGSRGEKHSYKIWSASSQMPMFLGETKTDLVKDLLKLPEAKIGEL